MVAAEPVVRDGVCRYCRKRQTRRPRWPGPWMTWTTRTAAAAAAARKTRCCTARRRDGDDGAVGGAAVSASAAVAADGVRRRRPYQVVACWTTRSKVHMTHAEPLAVATEAPWTRTTLAVAKPSVKQKIYKIVILKCFY